MAPKYSQQRHLTRHPAQHPPGQKPPLRSAWSLHWVLPLAVRSSPDSSPVSKGPSGRLPIQTSSSFKVHPKPLGCKGVSGRAPISEPSYSLKLLQVRSRRPRPRSLSGEKGWVAGERRRSPSALHLLLLVSQPPPTDGDDRGPLCAPLRPLPRCSLPSSSPASAKDGGSTFCSTLPWKGAGSNLEHPFQGNSLTRRTIFFLSRS